MSAAPFHAMSLSRSHPEASAEAQALQSAVDFVLGTRRFASGARQEG